LYLGLLDIHKEDIHKEHIHKEDIHKEDIHKEHIHKEHTARSKKGSLAVCSICYSKNCLVKEDPGWPDAYSRV